MLGLKPAAIEGTVQEVQSALDAAGIGNRVTASLDGSNQLVLTRSSLTGAATEIAISNVDATTTAQLGLTNTTVNGLDGFALSTTNYTGKDAKIVSIAYAYDVTTQLGRLVFSTDDNADLIEFDNVSTNAANKLGIFIGDGTVTTAVDGTNVVGKINGIDALGSGQLLRAASGNVLAKPGFYLNTAIGSLSGSTTNDATKDSQGFVVYANQRSLNCEGTTKVFVLNLTKPKALDWNRYVCASSGDTSCSGGGRSSYYLVGEFSCLFNCSVLRSIILRLNSTKYPNHDVRRQSVSTGRGSCHCRTRAFQCYS